MVVHAFNPSTGEEEAAGSLLVLLGQPGLQELVPGQTGSKATSRKKQEKKSLETQRGVLGSGPRPLKSGHLSGAGVSSEGQHGAAASDTEQATK